MDNTQHTRWRLVPCFVDRGVWHEMGSETRTMEGTLDEARERAQALVADGWDSIRIDAHGVDEVGRKTEAG